MGRGSKSCLGCGVVLLLVACVACVAASVAAPLVASLLTASLTANLSSSIDPAKAHQVGTQIADYTLPPGHGEQAGIDLLALQLVVITPKVFDPAVNLRDGYIISMLATRLPVDSGQLQTQLLAALLAQTQAQGVKWQQTGTHPLTIRGKPATLSILEDDPQHPTIRALSGSFSGKNGQTLVQIISKTELWNWTSVDNFLTSIR
jgi:hypothetical protein